MSQRQTCDTLVTLQPPTTPNATQSFPLLLFCFLQELPVLMVSLSIDAYCI